MKMGVENKKYAQNHIHKKKSLLDLNSSFQRYLMIEYLEVRLT